MATNKRVRVPLSEETYEYVRKECDRRGISISEFFSDLLRKKFAEEDQQISL